MTGQTTFLGFAFFYRPLCPEGKAAEGDICRVSSDGQTIPVSFSLP